MAAGTRGGKRRGREPLAEYRGKRDFERTAEPRGDGREAAARRVFVVQKHAASRLHYDLRLQVGGVMRSWAVPKGPSPKPGVRRLAVQVEDHPIEYNDFEGTIPAGQYGGGTVMLWDRGTYDVDGADPDDGAGDVDAAVRDALEQGSVRVVFHGERLRGAYSLVRTSKEEGGKPQWLLIKRTDDHAEDDADALTERHDTSVATGRTMEEIAAGADARRRTRAEDSPPTSSKSVASRLPSSLSPMLATRAAALPRGDGWTYEPKWDGIRVLALAAEDSSALVTRNGNDKSAQFPEVGEALRALAGDAGRPLVLDGEVVATRDGEILRFESLQERMHLTDRGGVERLAAETPAALVVFDLLVDGADVLLGEPWTERRERLEALLDGRASATLRLGETSGDAEALLRRAKAEGWEGLMAKRTDAAYAPGTRSRSWTKHRLEERQEFVVGGWTEPRGARKWIGSLLLGYYDADGRLIYAGHTGAGMSREVLETLHRRLKRRERKTPPFAERPKTNQTPHWTTPRVVVEVEFTEWTSAGKLRQPRFLGVRDDKDAKDVVREAPADDAEGASSDAPPRSAAPRRRRKRRSTKVASTGYPDVVEQLAEIEAGDGDGVVDLPGDAKLSVTSLGKLFFPGEPPHTKGDLLRYYAAMAKLVLPWMEDRPLVMRRFPNGIRGKSFYQQTPDVDDLPDGVRVETIVSDEKEYPRLVGGDLATLLYTVQLGAVSYDPWHSRVGHLDSADYTILDLDPGPGAEFGRVVEVARAVGETLDELGLHGALKTSGATGLHVYVPLAEGTPLEAAKLVAEIVATRVAHARPKIATVERSRSRRRKGTVYVDYLQNLQSKTVAGVYAVRARPGATVSTPLEWAELTADLDPRDFTIDSVPDRVARLGDLWAEAMREPVSLDRLLAAGAEDDS